MKGLYVFIFGFILITFSCKSSKTSATPAQIEALGQLVSNKSFEIESNWAYPQLTNAMQQILNSGLMMPGNSASGINLIGNPNFLKIEGDSIKSYLPYYGERQMQVSLSGNDSAIQFDGLMKDLEVIKNKDESYTLKFDANSKRENFQVFVRVFPTMKSSMVLNGDSRFTIRYDGDINPIEKE